jgi:hypothetical protein
LQAGQIRKHVASGGTDQQIAMVPLEKKKSKEGTPLHPFSSSLSTLPPIVPH